MLNKGVKIPNAYLNKAKHIKCKFCDLSTKFMNSSIAFVYKKISIISYKTREYKCLLFLSHDIVSIFTKFLSIILLQLHVWSCFPH